MWTIAKKEILILLYSPRFIVVALIMLLLLLFSLFTGYSSFEMESRIAAAGSRMAQEKLEDSPDLTSSGFRTIRTPQKLAIFDIGVTGVLGRDGNTTKGERSSMKNSPYSTDPSLALFGSFDMTFIVAEIMALFALIFSYDSISGEKENGTLKAIMANHISRSSIFAGKVIGIVIPTLLVFLLSFFIVLFFLLFVYGVNFSGEEWLRLSLMTGSSLVYISLFSLIGITASSLTTSRFSSLMLSLLTWILSVYILPSLVIQGVNQLSPPMSKAELTERIRAVKRDDAFRYDKRTEKYLSENPTTEQEWADEKIWAQITMFIENDKSEALEAEWARYDLANRTSQKYLLFLSVISPTAAFRNIQHSLADTGPEMMQNLNQARRRYQKVFDEYAWKQKLNAEGGVITPPLLQFNLDKNGIFKASVHQAASAAKMDISGLSRFQYSSANIQQSLSNIILQIGSILFLYITFLALAFVMFQRYDVR